MMTLVNFRAGGWRYKVADRSDSTDYSFLDAAVAPHRYVNFGGTLVDNPPHSARYGGSLVPVRVTAHS